MKIFLTISQVPELAEVPKRAHDRVETLALNQLRERSPWLVRLPVLLAVLIGAVGVLAPMALVRNISLDSPIRILLMMAGVSIGGYVGGSIGRVIVILRLRPHLREFREIGGDTKP